MQYNAATGRPHHKTNGIMNSGFDNPERPHTPSFIGSYSSVHDPHPPAAYVYGADEPGRKGTIISTSASTVGFLPPEKKKRRNKSGRNCIVVMLLACFIVLSIVMIVLYFTRPFKTGQESEKVQDNGNSQKPTPPPKKAECRTIPKPVAFTSLPKRLQTELNSLESFIKEKVDSQGPTAVTANIVYRDQVIWQAEFGVMNNSEANKRKPSANTVFPIASVSKVFTVLMLYKLHYDGSVRSLDDPVTSYQSDFSVKNPFNNAPITLRELASHRSGLQREAPCFPDTKANLCPYTQSQMIQRLKNLSLLREPGKEPQYSNLGFALLGQVLGQRFGNGRGFEGWMEDNMLSTFGTTDTTFALSESIKQRIPVGYTSDTEFSNVQEWGWLNPTGGAFSSVADLAKMEIALYKDEPNPYLSKALTEVLFAPGYILPNGKDVIGTPWEMTIVDDLLIRRKRGYVYGYDSLIVLLPEMKIAFNLLCTNCRTLSQDVDFNFSNTFLPAFKEVLRTAAQQEIVNPPDTKPYIGIFRVEGLDPLKFLEAKLKDGNIHLFVNGVVDYFVLNYTEPLKFRVVLPPTLPCNTIFSLGVDNDLVVYDSPSQVDGLSDKFTMFGAHPSGRTYFYRERKD